MKIGRPTKYKPEYCEIAETILSMDKPMCQVSHVLRVHRGTLRDWKKKHTEFSTACKRGRTAGKAAFMQKVSAAAWDSRSHPVNNTLISLIAVNQYKMKTRNSVNRKGTVSVADAVRRRHETLCEQPSR